MKLEIDLTSIQQTIEFANKLATQLLPGDVIALKGSLGAGKTTLSKYIINLLLREPTNVTSPTFQLLQIYNNNSSINSVYHYDLYRLKHSEEIYELAIDDALNDKNIVIIEWPEIIMHLLPKKTIEIEILLENKNRKAIVIDPNARLSL
jgi:tRNA threonylcarbamoyladenosine biosynthesis protein TsaE